MIDIYLFEFVLGRKFSTWKLNAGGDVTAWLIYTPIVSIGFSSRIGSILKRKRDRFVRTTRRIAMMLNPFPVYYIVDAIDCDHYRVTSAGRASCGWQYLKFRDDEFAQAEGPTSVYRVSRKVAENFRRSERDYGAEAYERGDPYSIRYD